MNISAIWALSTRDKTCVPLKNTYVLKQSILEGTSFSKRIASNIEILQYLTPAQILYFDADLPQKRNSVFGTNKFMRYFRSIIAARESIPKRRSVYPQTM